MKFTIPLLFSTVLMSALSAQAARTVLPLDEGWKFSRGDFPQAENPSFDDSRWEKVSVPHDWAIGEEFDINIDYQMMKVVQDGETELRLRTGRTGALPCFGIGWYRKSVDIPADKKGSAVFLEFDGAMSNAKVYCNGEYVGTWPYGYASFSLDATKFVKFGEKNTLAVRLDNKSRSSRWYSGAGLYRNARLVYKSPTHVAYNGTYITTPKVSKDSATVNIKTDVENPDGAAKISHKIYAPDNSLAASAESDNATREISVNVPNPRLWDIETPNLYRAVTSLFDKNGAEIDRYETRFGIRTIEFSRESGFVLNGKKVKIQGVCMHHDLGPIGAAVNERALRRQLETLKEMGCNSVRTSHNPPSPELLNLCDELGLTVQNEAFDEWRHTKCDNGYHLLFSEWAEKDLTAFVRRDRNHPCVIMWSIGNEVSDQAFSDGGATAKFLTSIVHREDPTRPVTAGIDNWRKAFSVSRIPHELDIVGINYRAGVYDYFVKNYPDMIFHGSETASTVSTRGTYHFPAKRNKNPFHEDYQVSAYDLETPPWGEIPDEEFAAVKKTIAAETEKVAAAEKNSKEHAEAVTNQVAAKIELIRLERAEREKTDREAKARADKLKQEAKAEAEKQKKLNDARAEARNAYKTAAATVKGDKDELKRLEFERRKTEYMEKHGVSEKEAAAAVDLLQKSEAAKEGKTEYSDEAKKRAQSVLDRQAKGKRVGKKELADAEAILAGNAVELKSGRFKKYDARASLENDLNFSASRYAATVDEERRKNGEISEPSGKGLDKANGKKTPISPELRLIGEKIDSLKNELSGMTAAVRDAVYSTASNALY